MAVKANCIREICSVQHFVYVLVVFIRQTINRLVYGLVHILEVFLKDCFSLKIVLVEVNFFPSTFID